MTRRSRRRRRGRGSGRATRRAATGRRCAGAVATWTTGAGVVTVASSAIEMLAVLEARVREADAGVVELEARARGAAREVDRVAAPLSAYFEEVAAGEREPDAEVERALREAGASAQGGRGWRAGRGGGARVARGGRVGAGGHGHAAEPGAWPGDRAGGGQRASGGGA